MTASLCKLGVFAGLYLAFADAYYAPLLQHTQNHGQKNFRNYKRQNDEPTSSLSSVGPSVASNTQSILTEITPSPGASPVAITAQSQIVTSYVPLYTLCSLVTVSNSSAVMSTTASPSNSSATATVSPLSSITSENGTGTSSCTTAYSATEIAVCRTTLTALFTKYTVTRCTQDLTFSTKYGYDLTTATPAPAEVSPTIAANETTNATSTITAAPGIQTLTTFYLANWAELTAGTAPRDVVYKVCQDFANGTRECVKDYRVWETGIATSVETTTTSIDISTTLSGSSAITIESWTANITDAFTIFSYTTTLTHEYLTHYTTVHTVHQPSSSISTSTQTLTVVPVSSSTTVPATPSPTSSASLVSPTASGTIAAGSSNTTTTITTTIQVTSTIYDGTTTLTIDGPAST